MAWASAWDQVFSPAMDILVFGKSGQVARCLQEQAKLRALGREDADLSDPDSCVAAIERFAPSAVINAAAYTAVDKAESEEDLATLVNGKAPAAMAAACAVRNIPFVHISTDYVFDGSGGEAWRPQDLPVPISAYGRSKLRGEESVRAAGGRFAILRTSWVFSAYGSNFVKTMMRLGAERDRLTIVADQVGGPTFAGAIAGVCLDIARQLVDEPEKSGIYHYAGGPDVSWADFAREIFVQAGLDCEVADIPTSEYPTPARRPANSRLDFSSTETVFGVARPEWRSDLRSVIAQIRSQKDHL